MSIKVNSAVTRFDVKKINTDDKVSILLASVSGKPAAEAHATAKARFENILIGAALTVKFMGSAPFDGYYSRVCAEVKNNSELYAFVKPGDATVTILRKIEGKIVASILLDLKATLDYISSMTLPSSDSAPVVVESEDVDL